MTDRAETESGRGASRILELTEVLEVVGKAALRSLAGKLGVPRANRCDSKDRVLFHLLDHRGVALDESLLKLLPHDELLAVCRRRRLRLGGRRKADLIRAILAPVPPAPARYEPAPRRWRPFPEARAFARSLGLLDKAEWKSFCHGELKRWKGTKPRDLPVMLSDVYRDEGWSGYRDFLGRKAHRPAQPGHRTFRAAQRFAQDLGLDTAAEWRRWCRKGLPGKPSRPPNIPVEPREIYPLAWRGWRDWLGTKAGRSLNPRWLPFEEARSFARGLGLSSAREWRRYNRGEILGLPPRPEGVPSAPHDIYRSLGYSGFPDWLGYARGKRRKWALFAEARKFARQRGLRNFGEWLEYARGHRPDLTPLPESYPSAPNLVYRLWGWQGWGDFLGTGNLHPTKRVFRSYERTRSFARQLGFQSSTEWIEWSRGDRPDLPPRPADVPADPRMTYRDCGWRSWGDFLGTGEVAPALRKFVSYREARAFARRLGLKTITEWHAWCRGDRPDLPPRPAHIPADPRLVYRDRGWKGAKCFFGARSAATGRRNRPPRGSA